MKKRSPRANASVVVGGLPAFEIEPTRAEHERLATETTLDVTRGAVRVFPQPDNNLEFLFAVMHCIQIFGHEGAHFCCHNRFLHTSPFFSLRILSVCRAFVYYTHF